MRSPLLCTEICFSRLQHCFLFLIVLGIVLGSSPRASAQGNWPMPGHDAQRTGRANFAGPTTAPTAPAWVFPTVAPITGDIVTSAEGKLYLASDKLYALNSDGTTFAPPATIGAAATGPVVDDIAGLVYVAVSAADGGFDLLSFTKQLQGGSVLLHVPRPPNGVAIISPLLLGPGGVIYFVVGMSPGVVYAAGTVQWSNPVCPGESGLNTPFGVSANGPALFNDGSSLIVVCGTPGPSGNLFKLDPFTGAQIASTSAGDRNSTEPAIDSLNHIHSGWQAFGGAIFCGDYLTWDVFLTLLTPRSPFCDVRFATSRAAVFPDGFSTVRIGFAFPPNNVLVADGAHEWASGTDGSTVPNFSSIPSVDAAGNVFIGNTQGIEALSSVDGHTLWSFSTGDAITTQPVVANGGALYVGSSSGKVYAFNASPVLNSGTVYLTGAGGGFITVDLRSASVVAKNGFTDSGAISVSPDGTRSYVSGIFGLNVVDNSTNQMITTIPVGARPTWNAISPDGSRVYVTQASSSAVFVIDTATNSILTSILVPGPQRVAVAPDNSRVYVGSNGRGIAVIDPATNTITHFINILGANTTGIAFTPDSAHAYVGEITGPSLYLIDARTDSFLQSISLPALDGGIGAVIASPDGKKIYAANVRTSPVDPARNVFVLDTGTNSAIGQIPVSFPASQMAITSDGADLLVGDIDIGELVVASIATDSVVETIHLDGLVISGIGTKPPAAATPVFTSGTLALESNVTATYAVTGPISFVATGLLVVKTLPIGTYVVQFADFPGFITPLPETVTIDSNSTTTVIGIYAPLPPSIANRSLDRVTRGQTIPAFEVDGDNFDPINATLSLGDGIAIDSYAVRTKTKIVVQISIAEDALLGAHDLTVTNLARQATLPNAVNVIRKPVIVLPGIMGSVLKQADSPHDVVWGNFVKNAEETNSPLTSCDPSLLPLALDPTGARPSSAFIFACGLKDITTQGESLNATELLVGNTGTGSDFYSKLLSGLSDFNVYAKPYDWRLDYETGASELAQLIAELAPNPWDRVDIVAHSQGGLIAETYIGLHEGDHRIGKIIFLGTPHLGATKSFATLKGWSDYDKTFKDHLFTFSPICINGICSCVGSHCADIAIFDYNTMIFLARTFPAVYELMPRYDFLFTEGKLEPYLDTYSSFVVSGPLRQEIVDTATATWAVLSSAISNHPKAFAINGTKHHTLYQLRRSTTSDCMVPVDDPFGDGTVPFSSAAGLPQAKDFFVDEEHAALPNNPAVVENVARLLNGADPDQLSLSNVPTSAPNSLKIHTCSPVRMKILDNLGNFDGVDDRGNLIEAIPNSSFFRFDTTEGVLLDLNSYTVNLKATDAGTFSLVFTAGDNAEVITQFTDIPISFASHASVQFDPASAIAQLQLDIDGDGTPDFTISSAGTAPVQSYLAALQNIVGSLTLTPDVQHVLLDRLKQATMASAQGHLADLRKKLLEFNTDVDKYAAKQLLTQSQAALLKDLSNKALKAF